jgi:hypothetical protein
MGGEGLERCAGVSKRVGHRKNRRFKEDARSKGGGMSRTSLRSGNRKGCDKMGRPLCQTSVVRATARVAIKWAGRCVKRPSFGQPQGLPLQGGAIVVSYIPHDSLFS